MEEEGDEKPPGQMEGKEKDRKSNFGLVFKNWVKSTFMRRPRLAGGGGRGKRIGVADQPQVPPADFRPFEVKSRGLRVNVSWPKVNVSWPRISLSYPRVGISWTKISIPRPEVNVSPPRVHIFWPVPRLFLPEVTRQTLLLYGSEAAVVRARGRIKAMGQLIIHPYSLFRNYWLRMTGILTVINIILVPFGASFFSNDVLVEAPWRTFSAICDLIFIVDLILNFFTGYTIDKLEHVLDSQLIKMNYIRTWFILDLIGVLPLDYILTVNHKTNVEIHSSNITYKGFMESNKLARVCSLLRLFRFSRLLRYVHYLEEVQDWNKFGISAWLSLIYVFCLIFLFWHWNSCLQFLIQKLLDFPENGWVHDEELLDKSLGYKYSFSLLRTLSHLNTLGYGTSKIPKGIPETWIVSISVLTGTALHILLVSRMTAVAASSNGSQRVYRDKYDELKIYLLFRRLPRELRCRVLEHLHSKFQGKWFDERKILQELSESLRLEVMTHSCRHLVLSVPWFVNANNNIINSIMEELKYEIFQINDTIFRKGAIGNKMYIIERGLVVIEDSDSEKELTKGNYFGENCLIGDRMRRQTARALTPCRVYSLSLESFRNVLDQYPSLKEEIEKATQEEKKLQEGPE